MDQLFTSKRAELFKFLSEHRLEEMGANMAFFYNGYKKQFSENPDDREEDLEVCIRIKNPDSPLVGSSKKSICADDKAARAIHRRCF